MKKVMIISSLLFILFDFSNIFAQSPQGKDFGFGIIVGDPTGGTVKFWTKNNNAFVIDLGASYFGSPRINFDYLWHFDAFESNIAKLYAGPGAVVGIGEGHGFYYKDRLVREDDRFGIGVRGIFGVNVIPENEPLEFFFELGVLMALAPDFDSFVDVGLGMRFYP